MKNLIIALSLFFAVAANAQSKKHAPAKATPKVETAALSNEEAARKNVTDMNAFITLSEVQKNKFQELFTTKYKMLNDDSLSAERKQYVSDIIGKKLEASLDAASYKKLRENSELFKKLTN